MANISLLLQHMSVFKGGVSPWHRRGQQAKSFDVLSGRYIKSKQKAAQTVARVPCKAIACSPLQVQPWQLSGDRTDSFEGC